MPGDLRLFDRLTGQEQLDSLARLRGSIEQAWREALIERFDVVLDRPIRELSRGNRQKIGIVQAFMHRPQVLVLDEPTSGAGPWTLALYGGAVGAVTAAAGWRALVPATKGGNTRVPDRDRPLAV